MAAGVFDKYSQLLAVLITEITDVSSKIAVVVDGIEKQTLVKQAERHVDDSRELLEQMELEVQQLQSSERHKYRTRLKSYQTEMGRLEKELASMAGRRLSDEVDVRDELFGGDDQTTRLLDNTEKLERSGRRLEGGYRVAIETEQVGAGILENLHSQRETISRARDRLRETDDDLGKSSRILTAMMRRILQNRVILYAVIVFMFIVIVLTGYLASS